MSRLVMLVVGLAACDPIWAVNVQLRDPADRPIETATVAVACVDANPVAAYNMAIHSDHTGAAHLAGLGNRFPVGCDVYIAKPGFRTQRIRYRDLCQGSPSECDRVFQFDLMLEPVGGEGGSIPPNVVQGGP